MPQKPAAIADALRQPTVSPKNNAPPRVTVKGRICRIAVTLAKGM
eukprot:CAMPEP_0184428744 /NCGR_PEP_ID=MMETSP0738-20130409/217724_1 /TAXON_ID=385413 /ORGANISM="Thalassiosira miniscula, Strain CCMP1093" /LENGTH=44 /DNA_ID= /DNA_START= /DNA_END= /DNA_ORIENTATION=